MPPVSEMILIGLLAVVVLGLLYALLLAMHVVPADGMIMWLLDKASGFILLCGLAIVFILPVKFITDTLRDK